MIALLQQNGIVDVEDKYRKGKGAADPHQSRLSAPAHSSYSASSTPARHITPLWTLGPATTLAGERGIYR
jgi:hypothetical protein